MEETISLKIDGQFVTAIQGQTILEAARSNNKDIPTMCFMEGLSAVGACRMCLVEVAGVGRLLPACTTPAQNGMDITTQNERLNKYRRMIVELLLTERNHTCAVCVSNGHCRLQEMASQLEINHVHFPYKFPRVGVDSSHARFVMDHNRCILCTRCVRVCGEVEGAHVWDIMSRGINSRVVSDLSQPWGESENCTSCGKCVQVCPTGALVEKGWAVEEMQKDSQKIMQLPTRRGGQ